MRIEITGRNVEITDEIRQAVHKRFSRVGNQVSELAMLEVEIHEERNPRIADNQVASANLQVKGKMIHASEASPDLLHTIHELAEDVRRQVKRDREMRRKRSRTRQLVQKMRGRPAEGGL